MIHTVAEIDTHIYASLFVLQDLGFRLVLDLCPKYGMFFPVWLRLPPCERDGTGAENRFRGAWPLQGRRARIVLKYVDIMRKGRTNHAVSQLSVGRYISHAK